MAWIANNNEKIVFVKNNDATLETLLITLLPSETTLGIESKLESNNTKCETLRAASLPEAMAIEQSASLKAKISLTPSPVMATLLPAFFKVVTNNFF